MRTSLMTCVLLAAASFAPAKCPEKRLLSPTFMELVVPDNAPRPADANAFNVVTDDMSIQNLFAAVGPPDGSDGTSMTVYVWCFADGSEVRVSTRDGTTIDNVRHDGKLLYKRKKK
jgi:hypothetical protein